MPIYYGGRPDIQAILYLPGGQAIDLSPYIVSLSLNKDLSQGAGVWELGLITDFLDSKSTALNPDKLSPFDYVEIKVRSESDRPYYYMRGFVDNVSLVTDGGASGGRMSRQLVANGRDYGALLQNYQIYAVTTDQLLKSYVFLQVTSELGLGAADPIPVNGFIYRVVHRILNDIHINGKVPTGEPKIPGLKNQQPQMKDVLTSVNIPSSLGVNLTYSNLLTFSGSLDDLLRQVESPPFGELLIRDDPDGPRVYARIPPYLKRNGHFANSWVKETHEAHRYNQELELMWVELQPQDILATNLTKSQNEVYTFFVSAVQGTAIQGDLIQAVLSTQFGDGTQNINPYYDGLSSSQDAQKRVARFGFRPLEVQSPWLAGDYSGGNFKGLSSNDPANLKQMQRMNRFLVDSMGRMEDLESGTITCRGIMGTRRGHNEIAARVGDYLFFQKKSGTLPTYYYIQAVDITWVEGAPLTETFQVTRGEQFLSNAENPQKLQYASFNPPGSK